MTPLQGIYPNGFIGIAVQIFTNNGPLAFLPLSDCQTSIVFSNNSVKPVDKKSLLQTINKYNNNYTIKKICPRWIRPVWASR